jgi:glycosyltransferase involved in cell wall biosynthesis
MGSVERRTRVLLVAEWFPPAYQAGGPIRSVSNLAELLGETHEVFVVAGAYDLGESIPIEGVELNCWVRMPWGQLMYVSRDRWQTDFWRELLATSIQPDFLYLNSMFARFFSLDALHVSRKFPKVKVVVAPRGMLGAGALAIKPIKKRVFLMAARWMGWYKDVQWHASTRMEEAEIIQQFKGASVSVAQNIPSRPMSDPTQRTARGEGAWKLVVLGRVHPKKNIEFGLKALGKALVSIPNPPRVEVQIIGSAEDLKYTEGLLNYSGEPAGLSVRHLGALPPRGVSEALAQAHYVLMPTHHENFGHAIVEGWAHGCLVLLSDCTPWKGLESLGIGWDWPLDEATWVEGLARAIALDDATWGSRSTQAMRYFEDVVRHPQLLELNRRIFSP